MPVRNVRRRYLYIRVNSDDTLAEEDFIHSLNDKVHFLYGVTGASEMNLRLIEWNDDRQDAIVQVHHTMLNEARTAVAHIREISGAEVRLDISRVSGTIKTLKSKISS